jgi:hypothetical protein
MGDFEIFMDALSPVGGYELHIDMGRQEAGQINGVCDNHDNDTSKHPHEQQVGVDDLFFGRLE